MSLTRDITATYRGPKTVLRRFLAQGNSEVRNLMFLLVACALIFVAQAPFQAREAELDPEGPLAVRLYWSAFLWIFIMPLILFGFSGLVWGISKVARRSISGHDIRLTLFWALLAATPVTLLLGLVAGFIGPGPQLQIVAVIWLIIFGWFWASGLIAAEETSA
ncbi:MAG: YIP1 family protein [Sulfitobacter sp.]